MDKAEPTLQDFLLHCTRCLEKAGVDSPRLSARLLAAAVLGMDRPALITQSDRKLSKREQEVILSLVRRRARGEPAAYILGKKEFYSRDFNVSGDVLVPRPETEHILEEVEKQYAKQDEFTYADIGTGSGILAITLAALFPASWGLAVDISLRALMVARQNAREHQVLSQISFACSNFTDAIRSSSADLVVANPPYIPEDTYQELHVEVRDFEPPLALVAGSKGLSAIKHLVESTPRILRPGKMMIMEVGQGQRMEVDAMLHGAKEWKKWEWRQDLAGIDRIVCMHVH